MRPSPAVAVLLAAFFALFGSSLSAKVGEPPVKKSSLKSSKISGKQKTSSNSNKDSEVPIKKPKFPKKLEEPDIEELERETRVGEIDETQEPSAKVEVKVEVKESSSKKVDEDFAHGTVSRWLDKYQSDLDPEEKAKLLEKYSGQLSSGEYRLGEVMDMIVNLGLEKPAPVGKKGGSQKAVEKAAVEGKGVEEEAAGKEVIEKESPEKEPVGKAARGSRKAIFPYLTKTYTGEPTHQLPLYPEPVNSKNVSFMSKGFSGWLTKALRQKDTLEDLTIDWSIFPRIKNQYGRVLTPRIFVMAIIMIESLGVHSARGKIYDSGDYNGFMQMLRRWNGRDALAPDHNIYYGVQHLWASFEKVFIKDREFRKAESHSDKLLMTGVLYNRGNYSTASKMRWKELVRSTKPLPFERKKYFGVKDNRMGVLYGLKLKAFLGLKFTSEERSWLLKFRKIPSFKDWCANRYSQLHNALLRKGSGYEP
jgi:hypothetical protein